MSLVPLHFKVCLAYQIYTACITGKSLGIKQSASGVDHHLRAIRQSNIPCLGSRDISLQYVRCLPVLHSQIDGNRRYGDQQCCRHSPSNQSGMKSTNPSSCTDSGQFVHPLQRMLIIGRRYRFGIFPKFIQGLFFFIGMLFVSQPCTKVLIDFFRVVVFYVTADNIVNIILHKSIYWFIETLT